MFTKKQPLTIDGIVADIQQKIDDLYAVSNSKSDKAAELHDQIRELELQRNTAMTDQKRAYALAENFVELLEV